MDIGNQTASRNCQFLSDDYLLPLHETFLSAFSDYVIPFALTATQFRNHLLVNGVDLARTVGFVDGDQLVGFSLNGFGNWKGRSTVYDAGTGVVPSHRRRGISKEMFALMLPELKKAGIEQFLLEVVTTNIEAIALYEKFGFRPVRRLAMLQCDTALNINLTISADIEIQEITDPDWGLYQTFWDGYPSWQNSVDSVTRAFTLKRFLGAFENGNCVGYIISSPKFVRVAQIAVSKSHRRRGIGTALMQAMKSETAEGFSMQVLNVDKSIKNTMKFFHDLGFYERLSQNEMICDL